MSKVTYVIVGGYFYSGSSAVVDLLKEYISCFECGAEIRFINDPYGLIQLENSLTDNWDWIRAGMALDDYCELCLKLSRKKDRMPFRAFGMGYTDNLNPYFVEITMDFINKLTDFEYDNDFYAYQAKTNYVQYILNRWRLGIEIYSKQLFKVHKKRMVRHAHPSKEEYYGAVKEYIDKLFKYQIDKQGKEYIIMDQAIHPRDSYVINRYFNNGKMIIVDRDPRDMFVQSILSGAVDYDNSSKAGSNFAKLQSSLHERNIDAQNVLEIHFEDLVYDYGKTVNKIESFLDLDPDKHVMKRKYFNPDISKKNIGLWRKYYDKYNEAIDVIAREMPGYITGRWA